MRLPHSVTPDDDSRLRTSSEANSAGETATRPRCRERGATGVWAADWIKENRVYSATWDAMKGMRRQYRYLRAESSQCGLRRKRYGCGPSRGKERPRRALAAWQNSQRQWSPDARDRIRKRSRRSQFIVIYEFGHNTLRFSFRPKRRPRSLPRWSPDGTRSPSCDGGQTSRPPYIPQTPLPLAICCMTSPTIPVSRYGRAGSALDDSYAAADRRCSFQFAARNRRRVASEQDGWNHLYSVPTSGGAATFTDSGKFETEDVALSSDKASVIYSSNQVGSDPNSGDPLDRDIDRRHLWRVSVEAECHKR